MTSLPFDLLTSRCTHTGDNAACELRATASRSARPKLAMHRDAAQRGSKIRGGSEEQSGHSDLRKGGYLGAHVANALQGVDLTHQHQAKGDCGVELPARQVAGRVGHDGDGQPKGQRLQQAAGQRRRWSQGHYVANSRNLSAVFPQSLRSVLAGVSVGTG